MGDIIQSARDPKARKRESLASYICGCVVGLGGRDHLESGTPPVFSRPEIDEPPNGE